MLPCTRVPTEYFFVALYCQIVQLKEKYVTILTDLLVRLDSQSQIVWNKIPQDDSVRFGGASTVATEHDAAQSFL